MTDDATGVGEDRALEAAAHLQRAALEFISAARILLDIAEEAVREPGGLASIVSDTLGGLANAAGVHMPHAASEDADAAPRRSGVEHIRVS
jgi:hypothetical protein